MSGTDRDPEPDHVRLPWALSDRPVPRRVLRPLQEFLSTSTAGGFVLIAAGVVALVWASSPWHAGYDQLWTTRSGVRLGGWAIHETLRGWVNDGLMTFFFLVAGLEIKRELTSGDLRDRRAALVPVAAAIGGMVVPAALYVAVNPASPGSRGWGMAMPTDIALTLGVLALASRRAPPSLTVFVLTLALVDDVGTIVVMLVAYSGGPEVAWLAAAVAIVVLIVLLERIHVRAGSVYVALGVSLWLALHQAGVNPTIAGVVMGMLAPAVPFQRPWAVSEEARRIADESTDDPTPPDADAPLWLRLARLSNEAVSPLARAEHVLLPWVSFVVLPLFALANAGVAVSTSALADAANDRVAIGLVVARLVGKPVGILAVTWVLVRTGLGRMPSGARWRHLVGVGVAASMAFTVSLFIAAIGFRTFPAELHAAKIAIIVSAVLGGAIGFLLLHWAPAAIDGETPRGDQRT
jgi:NhaA family Na+:H+ antiporter